MRVLAFGVAALLVACGPNATGEAGDGDGSGGSGGGGGGGGGTANDETCSQMDLLFIIDDSGSMSEEQGNLGTNFPRFLDVIHNKQNTDGELLDYRVAVTTTGITQEIDTGAFVITEDGDDGALRAVSGQTRPWIERSDGDAAALAATFQTTASVGTGGPSNEMPLRAFEMALGDRITDGTNAGFLRDDALLGIVILTDEDDCSRPTDTPFSPFNPVCGSRDNELFAIADSVDFLNTVAGGQGRWATAVIAGETNCMSDFGDAAEATRLKDFVAAAGTNGSFSSICAGDLTTALDEAISTFNAACESFPPID